MLAYEARNGQDTYRAKSPLTKIVVHPKYDGDIYSGFDIALGYCP